MSNAAIDQSNAPEAALPSTEDVVSSLSPFYERIDDIDTQLPRVKVENEEDFLRAEQLRKAIKEVIGELKKEQDQISGPFRRFSRWIDSRFKSLRDELSKRDATIREKMTAWRVAEDKRIAAEREAQRKLQEEQALKAAEAAKSNAEKDAILDAAATAPPPQKPTKIAGSSSYTVTTWKASVEDKMAVLRAVVNGDLPTDVISGFSAKALNKIAAETKKEGLLHGLKIYSETDTRMR